jgi:hypothetical protein
MGRLLYETDKMSGIIGGDSESRLEAVFAALRMLRRNSIVVGRTTQAIRR